MPFKIHLLIISLILAAVYVIHLLMPVAAPPVKVAKPADDSAEYSISVVRASWGMNCRITNNSQNSDSTYSSDNVASKVHEDNVLQKVSDRCNGQRSCDVPIDVMTLGPDPMPSCMGKQLQIDYRCFSFDRLWSARGSSGSLNLKCEKRDQ